ncbi:MAG: glutathione S-transferase family protein [Pontixanthobacter sp.]
MTTERPVRIFGPVVSTYVRVVEIVCAEAGLPCEVVPTAAHSPQNRHPFGKVPVVMIDGLELYETVSIAQYIDTVHNGGGLQPQDPAARAIMDRWIAVGNAYFFPLFEHGLVMPYVMHRFAGASLDEGTIQKHLPDIARMLSFAECELQRDGGWTGAGFTLADAFLYPMIRGVELTPQGRAGIAQMDLLPAWLAQCRTRPSISTTAWSTETQSP